MDIKKFNEGLSNLCAVASDLESYSCTATDVHNAMRMVTEAMEDVSPMGWVIEAFNKKNFKASDAYEFTKGLDPTGIENLKKIIAEI